MLAQTAARCHPSRCRAALRIPLNRAVGREGACRRRDGFRSRDAVEDSQSDGVRRRALQRDERNLPCLFRAAVEPDGAGRQREHRVAVGEGMGRTQRPGQAGVRGTRGPLAFGGVQDRVGGDDDESGVQRRAAPQVRSCRIPLGRDDAPIGIPRALTTASAPTTTPRSRVIDEVPTPPLNAPRPITRTGTGADVSAPDVGVLA